MPWMLRVSPFPCRAPSEIRSSNPAPNSAGELIFSSETGLKSETLTTQPGEIVLGPPFTMGNRDCRAASDSVTCSSTAKAWPTREWGLGDEGGGCVWNEATFLSFGPPPPMPPWKWQAAQDRSLNTGPS